MQTPITNHIVPTICVSLTLAMAGCATTAPSAHIKHSQTENRQLIRPGKLGGAADSRRWIFDFWNLQVISEDTPVGTVFMGDSITEFWNLPIYFPSSNGIIQNRGIGGDLASAMAKRFQADVVQLRPRNVIILAGTNDVTAMIVAKKADTEIIHEVTTSICSMMDQARAAGLNTLVCSLLPTNPGHITHTAGKPILTTINKRIKAACNAKNCIYVDYASQLEDQNGDLRKDLAYDGVHPNYAGYEVMTKTIQETATKHHLRL